MDEETDGWRDGGIGGIARGRRIKPQINSLTRQDAEFPLERKSYIMIWVFVMASYLLICRWCVCVWGCVLLHNNPLRVTSTARGELTARDAFKDVRKLKEAFLRDSLQRSKHNLILISEQENNFLFFFSTEQKLKGN